MLTRTDGMSLFAALRSLYDQELQEHPTDYLRDHGRAEVISHQINVFAWYAPHLPETGAVLDWGCNHAPDLCMMRTQFGRRYELHGCDFVHPETYPTFLRHADAAYQQLRDPLTLPYPAERFEVVIASGVLEHTAMEYESLKELYRVLRPGGLLVISFLPWRWSYQEWYLRRIVRSNYHHKRYDKHTTRQMLLRAGFLPEVIRPQSHLSNVFSNSHSATGWTGHARRLLRGLRQLASPWEHSVLCALARKRLAF